jgi:hypothetical protein
VVDQDKQVVAVIAGALAPTVTNFDYVLSGLPLSAGNFAYLIADGGAVIASSGVSLEANYSKMLFESFSRKTSQRLSTFSKSLSPH